MLSRQSPKLAQAQAEETEYRLSTLHISDQFAND
jgi:hypothetical protein